MADQGAAAEIAAGYATEAGALELGAVVVDGIVDPDARVRIPFATLNRHGLVAGATGTGKTKTLQDLAEQCSAAGVPVLLADIKGDLSGLARRRGDERPRVDPRAHETGDDWAPTAYPGDIPVARRRRHRRPGPRDDHRVRADPAVEGARAQRDPGVDARADLPLGRQQGLALLDMKDLRSVIQHLISDEGKAELKGIGGVSASTAGVILRALVNLEARGGDEVLRRARVRPVGPARRRAGRQGRG